MKISHFRGADRSSFRELLSLLHPVQRAYWCAWAALTDWVGNRSVSLRVLEAGRYKIRVLADSILGESLFLAYTWPLSCCVPTGALSGVSAFSFKDTSPIGLESHPYDLI